MHPRRRSPANAALAAITVATLAVGALFPSLAWAEDEPKKPPPEENLPDPVSTVDLSLTLGGAFRTSGADLQTLDNGGLMLGGFAYYAPSRSFALGLGYEHTDLGRERSGVGELGGYEAVRDLSTIWASVRLHVLRSNLARVYIALGPGIAWQSAHLSGFEIQGAASPPKTFTCNGSAPASLALRAAAGVEIPIGRLASFDLGATADSVRLSTDVMDDCAPGPGTLGVFGFRLGFTYGIEIGKPPAPRASIGSR